MPRRIDYIRKRKVSESRERAKKFRVSRNNKFIDRYPLGFGTVPEKIVYEQLSRRGIPFLYLNDVLIDIPELDIHQYFQADFVIPSLRIIIEVQGAHWHSMAGTIEADALKFAYYQETGWRPVAWWDYEILANINLLFSADPELSKYGYVSDRSTEMAVERRTKTDTSKGIRTLNRKRKARLQYRKDAPTVKARKAKSYGGYVTR